MRDDTDGDARKKNPRAVGSRGGDPYDQAAGGDDPVIGTEHRRAEPSDPRRGVMFGVDFQSAHCPSCHRLRKSERRKHPYRRACGISPDGGKRTALSLRVGGGVPS